ncbi:FAD-binding oxidoreductase [Thiomicrorhabdus xiamenensis]|uniref:FAD-binding oxidoreductase n=1 Tax=Thiomicrorhabdus xiamenensis TaxID=2739063 RepID=A0A7D4P5K8_9GAMM|nr:FAD-binding oxidoreductase [Thiomicrorhabdus xiamenensis]QKI89755.1 FAD-binding oxidoreductase [Thiomicrorhabdus xiamenensis]
MLLCPQKNLSGWGRFPRSKSKACSVQSAQEIAGFLDDEGDVIAYGNGRSYGDSAIADKQIVTRKLNHFLQFDKESGILRVQSGVLLSEILQVVVPHGWFLAVTPGTKLITVGGAIASDVHGKNHHHFGSFSQSVLDLKLMLPNGEIIDCSENENSDWFHATCGGQGLTGVILEARLQLKTIESQNIEQTTIKSANLEETFAAFEDYQASPYSVAWIDCLAKGKNLGRSLLMVGDFAADGDLDYRSPRGPAIPFNFPKFALNRLTLSAFNWLYYHKVRKKISQQMVSIDQFFYPLDALSNWNRIYGKDGFVQYQFILPKEHSYQGLQEILQIIAASGKGSFLAVLKLYGKHNANWLSFPMEGYSLALDFKVEPSLWGLMERLDEVVVKCGGRFYLAKDARVPKAVFEQGYPQIEQFRTFRRQHGLDKTLNSRQSVRLGL